MSAQVASAPLLDVLAAPSQGALEGESESVAEVLVFEAGNHTFAVPTSSVTTVLGARDASPLPDAPRHLLGMVPHEGRLLAVVDVSLVLGAEAGTEAKRLVVLGDRGQEVALATARVQSVRVVQRKALQPPLPAYERLSFVDGHWLSGSDVVVALSPERLLAELIRLAERGAR